MRITEIFNLNEYFSMPYEMWGWIAPGGKVHLATADMARSQKSYIHSDMIKKLRFPGYVKAWQAGWVRWFVLYGELKMETSEKISPELITTVTQGIKNITKLASDPNKIRHFFDDDEDTLPVYIWTYTLDAGGGTFYKEEIESPQTLINLMQRELMSKTAMQP
jgi:hypothetical protein